MRFLLATTAVGAIAMAAPASAETVISTAVTTPQSTSASGDIRISSTGSVKPASGVGVTINTNNFVKNEGTIQITGADNSAGIVANAGTTGDITNSGTITIDENYTATDSDNDGDIDGLFAQGSNRFGIHALGAHAGAINHSGTITIEGNNSGGIVLEGPLTGSLTSSGGISILGNNSIGIRTGDVSGNVTLSKGTITVQGAGATGVSLGNVGGALVIQNSIQNTGYRYTAAPADTSKLDADDLLQGGSGVVIGGNVAGGILFDAPPKDNDPNDTDEDDDGIADASETTATITTLGAAPAVIIGSSTADTTIGAVAGSGGRGLVIKGGITGNGVYKNVAGNGLVIGGLGHAVNVTGGLTNSGTIAGRGGAEADGTAVRIGAGASVPTIENSGTIGASGGGTATTGARAILIDAGATVTTIRNTGIIQATRVGSDGIAAGIVDNSGTLSLIENSGTLGVSGADVLGDKGIAFDLRANGAGATVRQLAVTTGSAPQINGQMLFGAGNDTLDVADGSIGGTASFGAGNNTLALSGDAVMNGAVQFGGGSDTVQLGGTSRLTGNVDFGGGADVFNLSGTSVFSGQLSNSAGLAVNVGAGSTFGATNLGTVSLASLTTGTGSTLGVTLDSSASGVTLYDVAGAADIGTGTTIDINLVSLGGAAGTYKVLQAGALTGATNLSTTSDSLPFLFDSSVVTSTPNEVSVVVRQKTAEELGINASEASILTAVIGAADADAPIAAYFLGIDDSAGLQEALQQMLPDHAGGAFETATKGSRLTGRILADPKAPLVRRGTLGFWAQQVAWGGSKAIGATSSYEVNGWGAAGGVETTAGPLGNFGLMLSYLGGKDGRKSSDNELTTGQYEGGAYWRGGYGPLRGFARATAGTVGFDGVRVFSANVNGTTVTREAKGKWNGRIYSAMGGMSYDLRFGRLSLRPAAQVEYYRLKEKGYTEKGGGDAFNLTVSSRSSSETAATGTLAIGYELLGTRANETFARIELEGGRREILSGSLGATTARFGDGTPFTLTPEKRTSGFLGSLRMVGGGSGLAISAELNAEEQQNEVSLGGRLGLQFSF